MLYTSVMIKPASGSCNMRCEYCFYCDEMANRTQGLYGYMSEQTLQNVIRKTMLRTQRHITYAFQGGEPTLCGLDFFRKVIEFEKKYNRAQIAVSNVLQTNGYALNEDWCRFFKENNFLVGVSVDGTQEMHDRYRHSAKGNKPTYETVRENIRLLEKYGVEYNILTVITEDMADSAKQIYESYARNGWGFQQYIECLDPLMHGGVPSPYSLQAASYGRFLTELFELWYRDLKKGKQPYIRRFENYIGILAGYPPESCEQCGECGIQLVVEADGSVYPCDFYVLDEYRLGNFNTDRMPQIDEKREEIGFVARSRKIARQCKSCPYYPLCRNGCQRSREYLPQEDAYINRFCEGYRYFFDHCIDRMREIAANLPK